MSLYVSDNIIPPWIQEKIITSQTASRGTGANVHNALRDVLWHLRAKHGFTRDEIAEVLSAPDSPARRADIPAAEIQRMVDGLFADGFQQKIERIIEAKQSGEALTPAARKPEAVTEEMRQKWQGAAACMMFEKFERLYKNPLPPESYEIMLGEDSPVVIPEKGSHQFLTALDCLYKPSEVISLVTACTPEGSPIANDRSMYPQGWRTQLNRPNNIGGKAGVWWRHNPVSLKGGSGKNGAVKDSDIPSPRYLLLESDILPRHSQAAIFLFLIKWRKLPIRCITASGGKSLHALVEMSPETYAGDAPKLLGDLHQEFGFDKGNSNPSRMSRAPGFVRGIGAKGDGFQRLIYLSRPDGQGFTYDPEWTSWKKWFGEKPEHERTSAEEVQS